MLLLLTLGVYVYRDIWPLATYFLQPEDRAEGNILWIKISLLAVTAIIIPLFIPNAYIPADPKVNHPFGVNGSALTIIHQVSYAYPRPRSGRPMDLKVNLYLHRSGCYIGQQGFTFEL